MKFSSFPFSFGNKKFRFESFPNLPFSFPVSNTDFAFLWRTNERGFYLFKLSVGHAVLHLT